MFNSALIDKARAVPIEAVIAERNIKLSPGRIERCGPCPMCGGRDRFSINVRKQVFNCRGCGAKGDVIALVGVLDGVDFRAAVETLAGPEPAPKPNGGSAPVPKRIFVAAQGYTFINRPLLNVAWPVYHPKATKKQT
jgi:CHC2 zinc finger